MRGAGFRRIAFFPDRPDVLSVYRVRMAGDKAAFPILLSNGNCTATGDDTVGTHWAEWHDPWPKPSYLFALVAGQLVANSDRFTTASGREVALNIWVRAGDEARTAHAMASLKHAMAWDETAFGREYDLDLFNIVAVSDFNMGAMENKGLNVFNTRYVLADPETATDGDYDAVEGVIAHEYFHNWSGNRVTCRDWFQLSLKEGFTVLRDQMFSADMGSEPVKRIEDVRVLRVAQFPEDSGPLAHPIRPDSFREISNFYTATVYNKGAEVIRMMRTLADFGTRSDRFRAGTDLYFAREDGKAATCEDFIRAIEDGAGLDLTQFRRWYSQAGTPQVTAALTHQGDTATLRLAQRTPPTPGQVDKLPVPIPLRLALFDRATATHHGEQLVVLDAAEAEFAFPGFTAPPVLSLNRDFFAPVAIAFEQSADDLLFLAAHDDDPFARYEAMQRLAVRHLLAEIGGGAGVPRDAIGEAVRAVIADPALDDLMRGELMVLPSETYLADQLAVADPGAIHAARERLKAWLGQTLASELGTLHDRAGAVPFGMDAAARGARKLKTQALGAARRRGAGRGRAARRRAIPRRRQYDRPPGRADGAVRAGRVRTRRDARPFPRSLCRQCAGHRQMVLAAGGSLHPDVVAQVKALAGHADFTMANPNRVRALYMAFAGNPSGFHAASGEGYAMIGDLIRRLDATNAQTAARFVPPLGRWRRIEPERSALMRAQLEAVAATPGLSRDNRRAGRAQPWLRSRRSRRPRWPGCRMVSSAGVAGCRWAWSPG